MKKFVLIISLLLASVLPAAAQTVDPRTDNAKAFHINSAGLVDGVELVYVEKPYTSYQLVQARLIDEAAAAGATVAKFIVVDCFGTPISENVWMAWAWPELVDGKLLPGNQNNEHMITNGYSPPELGPLALYVGDSQGRINSDVIGGLGLPFKRHVSFYLAWRKRCGTPVVPPTATPTMTITPTPGPTSTPAPPTDLTETNDLLRQILSVLKMLAGHLGVSGY